MNKKKDYNCWLFYPPANYKFGNAKIIYVIRAGQKNITGIINMKHNYGWKTNMDPPWRMISQMNFAPDKYKWKWNLIASWHGQSIQCHDPSIVYGGDVESEICSFTYW